MIINNRSKKALKLEIDTATLFLAEELWIKATEFVIETVEESYIKGNNLVHFNDFVVKFSKIEALETFV